jgi:hypothetical protein
MIRYLFFLLCIPSSIFASAIADFNDVSKNKNVTFFLSTPKSGTNLITGCLSAITRKPISWFYWGTSILNPASKHRNHISYNRLALPLISDIPLLYRTHYEYAELLELSSQQNKLIFATRNPKELLYRKFFQTSSSTDPDPQFIEEFLKNYLLAFDVYNSWFPETRIIVFYEDFINNEEDVLLELLHFMEETPVYLEDFLNNKQQYFSRLLESYTKQHVHNSGGASSRESPKPIFYTRNASLETLKYIDEYLQKTSPQNWEKYLKRFQIYGEP